MVHKSNRPKKPLNAKNKDFLWQKNKCCKIVFLKNETDRKDVNKLFNVFHQDIRGLRGKINELLSHLNPSFPQIFCFTEHHMNIVELKQFNIDSYKLGAYYCRTLFTKGGVCIYLQKKKCNVCKY
jgi:hypothetical protein